MEQEIVSGSDISWAICKSAPWPRHNHASIPPLSFLQADAIPAAQPTVSKHRSHKHWRHFVLFTVSKKIVWFLICGEIFKKCINWSTILTVILLISCDQFIVASLVVIWLVVQDGDEGFGGASDNCDTRCADRGLHSEVFMGQRDYRPAESAVVQYVVFVVRTTASSSSTAVGMSCSLLPVELSFFLLSVIPSLYFCHWWLRNENKCLFLLRHLCQIWVILAVLLSFFLPLV